MRLGTGAIEIKSGYVLTIEGELKMLRVLKTTITKLSHNDKSHVFRSPYHPIRIQR